MNRLSYSISGIDSEAVSKLSVDLGLHPVIAGLLVSRGHRTGDDVKKFMDPSLEGLRDPFLMADMEAAVERILKALRDCEKIMVHGDYDADGLTSSALLIQTFRSLGAEATVFIPNRLEEGYGLNSEGVDEAKSRGASLIVTCDCGITSNSTIDYASSLGIDTVVTDHHQPEGDLPNAAAVVDPHRPDCSYPFKGLAGVGVAMKLIQALLERCGEEPQMASLLRMCAIGTVADVVPLVDENRIIAHHGLSLLPGTPNIGLKALLDVAGLANSEITAYDISFRIAPRINAMGRFGHQDIAMDLFFTRDRKEAAEIAATMDRLNTQRQKLVDKMVEQAVEQIESRPELLDDRILVLADERWHKGVVGIVASKIVEAYGRPTLTIAVAEGVGVGSGRSIPGFSLVEALAEGEDLMSRFGGHAMAAGFELAAGKIPELRRRLVSVASRLISEEDVELVLDVDSELKLEEIDNRFEEQFARLEPFGYGNTNPLFLANGVRISSMPRILKEKHVKLQLGSGRSERTALAWRKADAMSHLRPGDHIDIIYQLFFNTWRNERHLELDIKEFCSSELGGDDAREGKG